MTKRELAELIATAMFPMFGIDSTFIKVEISILIKKQKKELIAIAKTGNLI